MRWGTSLHDRFMLPQFVWEDFLGVLADLRRRRLRFDPVWFEAQREFRFPFCGRVDHGGVELEIRQALEPWHVHGRGGRRRRHGALCRLLRSSGCRSRPEAIVPNRHVITCNGRTVPMAADGRGRRSRRRRALQGLEARLGSASDDSRACAAHLRHSRCLERPLARRLRLSCRRIRAGAIMILSRSIRTRRRRGGWRGSRITAILRVASTSPPEEARSEFPMTLDLRRPAAIREPQHAAPRRSAHRPAWRRWTRGYAPAGRHRPTNSSARTGDPHAHWERILRGARQRSSTAIEQRFDAADRHIRDMGMSYRVMARPHERAWPLSHLPLLIQESEWREIARGVASAPNLLETDSRRHLRRRAPWCARALLPAAAITGIADSCARLRGVNPPGGRLPQPLRRRHRPRTRRALVGARPIARRRPPARAMRSRTGLFVARLSRPLPAR